MAISTGDRQKVMQLVEQLPEESLGEVVDLLNNLLRQTRQSQSLISSKSEELLLQVIGRRLLPDDQARLDYLREQNENGDITEVEHQELLAFVARVENEDAERAAAILQLAQSQVEVDDWQYLAKRNHPWRKQLYVKGQKLMASTIWRDMIANEMSVEETADNWNLPLGAIDEIIRYCESYQDLLKLETEIEFYKLSCNNEKSNLDEDEQELLDSIENDNWISIPDSKLEIQRFQDIAKRQVSMQKIELQMSLQDSDKIYNLANQHDEIVMSTNG